MTSQDIVVVSRFVLRVVVAGMAAWLPQGKHCACAVGADIPITGQFPCPGLEVINKRPSSKTARILTTPQRR